MLLASKMSIVTLRTEASCSRSCHESVGSSKSQTRRAGLAPNVCSCRGLLELPFWDESKARCLVCPHPPEPNYEPHPW